MNQVKWLKGYLQTLQDTIPAPLDGNGQPKIKINRNRMVIDDSQLTKFLSDQTSDFNYLLIGVLPDFSSNATTADDYMLKAATQLMILKKTTTSEYDHDAFMQIFEDTYEVVELVVQEMLKASASGCSVLRWLNVPSISIIPVWNRSECNGWSILFNFDKPL